MRQMETDMGKKQAMIAPSVRKGKVQALVN